MTSVDAREVARDAHRRRLEGVRTVFVVLAAMLVILVVAALVVVYVAYPHRGEQMPRAAWIGKAMDHATGRVDVLDEERDRTVSRR